MSWSKQSLALPATPPSVRQAREWVARVLVEIGRPELADSARLAVSELVTNAILHADPPMTINVRGTREHPRIEVTDQSLVPPQPRTNRPEVDRDDELTWTTGGRGLDLVASHAVAWGADIDPQGEGKVVWFEPAAEPREAVAAALFDLDQALAERDLPEAEPDDMVRIELIGFPVELFLQLRLHFGELGRELRLLALSDPDRYPMATEFTEVFLQVEHERRQVLGLDALARAAAAGVEAIDLHYVAPRTAPATMARIGELLEELYTTFPDDTLLAVRPNADLVALQRWYLGEFARQGAGEEPTPWTGPTRWSRRQEVS
ncbi:ATP-binding protein [Marmoricola sp. RAF53]|uniref:ATP-binding protein n=1 Tax=Marmoricola sp. RAF53 TaxID=3233059 RepID=UPI003F95CF4E